MRFGDTAVWKWRLLFFVVSCELMVAVYGTCVIYDNVHDVEGMQADVQTRTAL